MRASRIRAAAPRQPGDGTHRKCSCGSQVIGHCCLQREHQSILLFDVDVRPVDIVPLQHGTALGLEGRKDSTFTEAKAIGQVKAHPHVRELGAAGVLDLGSDSDWMASIDA